ncbi:TPA: phosphoribosylformylglycinamidine synthase, partial [Candidatus Woesearchaeota archaeon]|nr:phosphoribosylformylglycinamidine synthase [Candidatus Woesearchaeota archaeon]
FYHAYSKIGSKAPRIDAKQARKLYEKMYELHKKGLLSACSSVGAGGIAMTLAKMAIAGQKGASIDISKIPNESLSPEKILYSESQSRFIVSINPENKKAFENEMNDFSITRIGIVKNNKFKIKNKNKTMINITISDLDKIYRARFRDF